MWDTSYLKKQYHLILIDLLGCGQSALPEDFDYSLHSQASFLEKIIKKLMVEKNITNFHLAGHYPHVEKPKDVARDIALFLG
ncbi:MAG TPA: hypothetical protein EYG95_05010 [Campylobacterales bacterium]|nr:hypothetical protein [Campylobacterales bacterium]